MSIKFLHNPRCSKSRQTLALLEENGVDAEVELYLEQSYSKEDIKALAKKLGITSYKEMMRVKDELFKTLSLNRADVTEEELLLAMTQHSALIERPIVINGAKARIGRPPELVLDILS